MLDRFADDRDLRILEKDLYSFFVLRRILTGECDVLLTDHKRIILCFTKDPYPVWIWTPDDATEEEMQKAYRIASEQSLLDGRHRFNMKYGLADYFIRRSAEDGRPLFIETNMFAYDCPNPVKPETAAGGSLHRCTPEDTAELVEFINLFHQEIGSDRKSLDDYRADAEDYIRGGNTYLWKNESGTAVASCKYVPNGSIACINLVFTRPEFRRRHYAENLVYRVTAIAGEAGYTPMLYTDADYTASNACYQKIGYILRGSLCTLNF